MIRRSPSGVPRPPRGGEHLAGVIPISERTRRSLAVLADIAQQAQEIDETIESLQDDAERNGLDLLRMACRLQDIEEELAA